MVKNPPQPEIRVAAVVLDAADIRGLAAFYQALLGGEVSGDDGWLELTRDGAAHAHAMSAGHPFCLCW